MTRRLNDPLRREGAGLEALAKYAADLVELPLVRAELAQARTALDDFTHSVAHDLRAPLRHITSYAQILQEDLQDAAKGAPLAPAIQASLDAITQAAKHQAALIDGLTALARVSQAPLQSEAVALADLVADVRQDVERDLAPQLAGRTITWQVAPALPAVQADAALLRGVLQQVLTNALKFTRHQPVAQIDVEGAAEGANWMLTIRDNGAGFNPQYAGKLFKALSRLHSATAFEGIGMGLALSHAAVQRMGGAIAATGVVDGGCTVTITLPLVV